MPPSAIDFFAQAKARSLHKLDLYGKYLPPLVYKWGSMVGPGRPSDQIWIVDGFAGAGSYLPEGGGTAQDGSPLVAAKWAREIERKRGYPPVRCINVERDDECFQRLRSNLAPWKDIATNLHGTFAQRLDEVLDVIKGDPALIFLDPFGVNGIEMPVLEKILARPGKTELLVHFSDKTFMRMAGHLGANDERLEVGEKVAESKLERLDAVIGSPLWRPRWGPGAVDIDSAMDATAELYLSELRTRTRYAHQIRIRDSYYDRTAYRLVFCTGSAHGVELMSDLAYRYEKRLKEEADAGAMTFWDDQNERQRLTDLRDAIQASGLQKGTATSEELIHQLAPAHFGLYKTSEYAKMIRELVGEGIIDRPTPTGIKPRELLTFKQPAQGSLLG